MNPSFRTSLNSLAFALVWIRLPAMPSALWSRYTLKLIVQLARHLIKVDQETELQSKVQFARVVVEVDLSHPLFPGANVDVEGEIPNFWQTFEYEYIHLFCRRCGRVGYRTLSCCPLFHATKAPSPVTPLLKPNSAKVEMAVVDSLFVRSMMLSMSHCLGFMSNVAVETLDPWSLCACT